MVGFTYKDIAKLVLMCPSFKNALVVADADCFSENLLEDFCICIGPKKKHVVSQRYGRI